MRQYTFRRGNRVTIATNMFEHGVLRGDTATVVGVTPHHDKGGVYLTIKLDSGKQISIRSSKVRYTS